LERTEAQRRFDALHAVFVAAERARSDGRSPEPLVNIVVDQHTFESHLAHAAGGARPDADPGRFESYRCETDTGVQLDPADAVAAALVGRVRRVVLDATDAVINLGRSRRVFTGAARDAVLLQHRRCLWPGCGLPARRSQIDHRTPWGSRERGPTDAANGDPLCGRHNRWKTRGYRTWRDPDGGWHLARPDGTDISQPWRAGGGDEQAA
jgi:hypothetical protein